MKINLQHSTQYQNFSGRNLFRASLPLIKGTEKIPCFVTEMTQEDIAYFTKYQNFFSNKAFAATIVYDFLTQTRENMKYGLNFCREKYLMVEEVAPKSPKNRVKALAKFEITKNSDNISLKRLISAKTKKSGVSGAAACILYALSKYAQKFDKDRITLIATNSACKFYKSAGFIQGDKCIQSCFYLPKDRFIKFQASLERHFNIYE